MGKLDHGRVIVVESLADLLVERENRLGPPGVERWTCNAVDAGTPSPLPADAAGGRIGQRRAVKERPDHPREAQTREQLRQDR